MCKRTIPTLAVECVRAERARSLAAAAFALPLYKKENYDRLTRASLLFFLQLPNDN